MVYFYVIEAEAERTTNNGGEDRGFLEQAESGPRPDKGFILLLRRVEVSYISCSKTGLDFYS